LTPFVPYLVGPDLGDIEGVESVVLSILGVHDLDVDRPRRSFTTFDRLEEITSSIVGIFGGKLTSFSGSEVLDTLIGFEVPLDILEVTLSIDQLEGVGRVTVHEAVTIGSTTVGEEDGDLMDTFGHQRQEIPEGIRVATVSLGVTLLSVDEVREFGRVADKEDGGIVANHVPVAFFSVEFDGETTRITSSVSATLFTTNSRESSEDGSTLANVAQELGLGETSNVMSHLYAKQLTVSGLAHRTITFAHVDLPK
jgi:hypothetical protein